MVARGEVWWYEAPEEGRRPYLVLTRNEAIPVLNQVMAVPATRRVRRIPTEVALDRSDGMPVECVLSVDNLTMKRKALFTTRVARLGPDKMREVCDALRAATAC